MLDGSMLNRPGTVDLLPFIFYLSTLALLLIFNTYYAERKAREAERLRRDMTSLRITYIQTKSDYMYLTRQSEIARQLESRGFVEADEPPVIIHSQGDAGGLLGIFRRRSP